MSTLVRKLSDWLSTDAIRFDLLFVRGLGEKSGLVEEADLMRLLLREQIERGDATVRWVPDGAAAVREVELLSRSSQVHCLATAAEPQAWGLDAAAVTQMVIDGSRPRLDDGVGGMELSESDDAFAGWQETLLRVLQLWI